jgi:serine/threonine protein kinase
MKKIENLSLDSFSPICVLGKGSYAHVLLVEAEGAPCHHETTKTFALKMVDKTDIEFRKLETSIFQERDILRQLENCSFTTDLLACFQGEQDVNFLLEFCPGGDLFERLTSSGPLNEQHARFYIGQIALALHQIHEHNVVFRDLKPENLLIDAQGYVKLADFGCSAMQLEGLHGLKGTPEYMSPEMVKDYREQSGYDKMIDWWALGCLMFEMLFGKAPFCYKNRKKLYDAILNEAPELPRKVSDSAKDLLRQLLEKDPTKRMDFKSLKEHSWFGDFNWGDLESKRMSAPWVPKTEDDMGIGNFNKKFVDMDFDGINCGMSDGFWMDDLYFESSKVKWIHRVVPMSQEGDFEEFESDHDTRDEGELGRCGSFSEFEWSEDEDRDHSYWE